MKKFPCFATKIFANSGKDYFRNLDHFIYSPDIPLLLLILNIYTSHTYSNKSALQSLNLIKT